MLRIFLALLSVLLPAISPLSEAETLRIYNWKNYIDTSLIDEFQKASGIDVQLVEFTTVEQLETAIYSEAGFDIVVPSHFQLRGLIESGQLEKIDKTKLSNYSEIDGSLLAALASFGGANAYAIPYLWTAIGIAYDRDALSQRLEGALPQSWSLAFYDDYLKALAPCGVSWLDAPEEIFSLKANLAGQRLDQSSERRISGYSKQLIASAAFVHEINNLEYIGGLADGRLCMAVAWAGHALDAQEIRPTVDFMLPLEGGLLTIDSWAILADAPNKEAAYAFIDFMLAPTSARQNSSATNFFSHLPASVARQGGVGRSPTDMLGPNFRQRLYFVEDLTDRGSSLINQHWQSIRNIH